MPDLTVTNAYSKGRAKTTLTINGNVEISNFKQGEAKPSAFVQAKVTDNKVSVQSNKGNVQTLDLSNEKYSVMLKIANSSKYDSGAGELSWYDLRDTDKAKLGLDDSFEIKKDLKAGILNIYKKVGDKLTTWLHIDFETNAEKNSNSQQVKTQKSTTTQKGKFVDPNTGVKKQEIITGESGDVLVGYSATKGNITTYYDSNKKLVGLVEKIKRCDEPNANDKEHGTFRYKDKNGRLLYTEIRTPYWRDSEKSDITFLDSSGKLKYEIESTDTNESVNVYEYDSNENLKKKYKNKYPDFWNFTPDEQFVDLDDFVKTHYL